MGNSHARRHFRSDSINYLSLGKIAFGRSYQNDERINQQPPRIFCSTRTTQMDRIDPDTFSDSYDIENTGRESAVSAPTPTLRERLIAMSQPCIPRRVWDALTGKELEENLEYLDPLVQSSMSLVEDTNEWIDWKQVNKGVVSDGDILVWTGRAVDEKETMGGSIPFVKTKSIIPLSVSEMVDLLLDSEKVKTYNQWSLGRQDCWVYDEHTKIVRSKTQPPLGGKTVTTVTLLHARQLEDHWVVVSRSVGGKSYHDDEDIGRSDILLGINFLQGVDDESCILTAVTHVYSPAVPKMLAETLGVKSAINFVKDMRKLKEPL